MNSGLINKHFTRYQHKLLIYKMLHGYFHFNLALYLFTFTLFKLFIYFSI